MSATMLQLLKEVIGQNGSELHLSVNSPPQIRVDGYLRALNYAPLDALDVTALIESYMDNELKALFAEMGRVRYEFLLKELSRFEVQVYRQRGFPAAVYKAIPFGIRGFKELGLPALLGRIHGGLHLIGGMAGSGRSTTLAALVDYINREISGKLTLVSLEASAWHSHKRSLVDQIVVGKDVNSIEDAMEVVLAARADVIAVEGVKTTRDWSCVLHVAQCGVPTFATCTGKGRFTLLQEIILLFPPHQQSGVRRRLAQTLNYVVMQKLLPRATGTGSRVLAVEYLHVTKEVRHLIQVNQMTELNVSSRKEFAGWSWNPQLAHLYFTRLITLETALKAAKDLLGSDDALQDLIGAGPAFLEWDPPVVGYP